MSLYADYVLEREGKSTVETEDGFATFTILAEGRCYIESLYVRPECRNKDVASKLADEVVKIAKEQNCKILLGSVSPVAKNANDSLKVLLAYGFKLDSAEKNFILLAKEI